MKKSNVTMNELSEYSNEYRKSLDYICFTLNLLKVRSILIKEKSPHFILGVIRRFFHSNIDIFVDTEKSEEMVFEKLGKRVKTYNLDNIDVVIFPFSLEDEENWIDKLNNTLREVSSEFVVVAFRNPFSHKLFLGRGTKETLNPLKVRAILKENSYSLVEEKGGLHLKYIFYSLVALIFEKVGLSALHFRFVDRASNSYLTDNCFLRNLSYIQIIIARKGSR
ncbi:MAG: hypothetical protein QME59_03430 [Candidatus Hydrothermarchaeota archaeon]|nr:hypothetical protein [Candidatus Hydrothermarchaeota archaeon]